jgi:hypothetical protein
MKTISCMPIMASICREPAEFLPNTSGDVGGLEKLSFKTE